jgi:pimeloyl-ACP methyl ester carboxylesterase
VRRAAAFAPIVALLVTPATAAAIKTHPCPDQEAGARCGTVRVKLDRAGKVKGTIPLRFAYRGKLKGKTPILALQGGPGGAGILLLDTFSDGLSAALRGGRAVIAVDQRGTGGSGLLRCRPLEKADLLKAGREAATCAKRLGARRDYYTSEDSVADLDELRRALGIRKWAIYGVSYGTYTAALYAQRHAARVDRLVLDSVVDPEGADALYGPTFAAIPRVLRELCRGGLCKSVTPDIVADVAKLVTKLAGKPLHGFVVGRDGRRHKATLGRNRLFSMLLSGDFDESLRSELPTAVRSALRDDPAPILRLAKRAADIEGGGDDPKFLSVTLYAATVCTDQAFPWDWNADVLTRLKQAREAVAAIPAESLHPFDRETALDSDEIQLCSRWPARRRAAPPARPPLPDVRTLLVEGADDLRTPLESAQKMASQLPRSSVVAVPGMGHAVYGSDVSGCSDRALAAFFTNRRVSTKCRRTRGRLRPDGPIPGSLAELDPAAAAGQRGRTVSAAALTMYDVLSQSADSLLTDPFGELRGGGLRGGTFIETATSIRLRGLVFVPGVTVSGDVFEGGAASLRISGAAAADGRLRFRGSRVTGVLGGRRVSGRIRSLSRPAQAEISRLSTHLAH